MRYIVSSIIISTLQVDFDEMSVSNRFVVKPNVDAELDKSKYFIYSQTSLNWTLLIKKRILNKLKI